MVQPGAGPELLRCILTPQAASDPACSWADKTAYAPVLASLLYKSPKDHMDALNAVQVAFDAAAFPKAPDTGVGIIDTVFTRLFAQGVLPDRAFAKWKEDHDSTVPGRTKAVIQTTKFFALFEEEDESQEDED